MTIKEITSKTRKLRNEAADLETIFHNAVVKYLDTIVGVASCASDDTDGKACLEEILSGYDSDNDLVTMEYTLMNKYGDLGETKQIVVSASEIEKHILMN